MHDEHQRQAAANVTVRNIAVPEALLVISQEGRVLHGNRLGLGILEADSVPAARVSLRPNSLRHRIAANGLRSASGPSRTHPQQRY